MSHLTPPSSSPAWMLPLGLLCVALAGCAGTEVGNPGDEATVTVQFTATARVVPGGLTLDSGVVVEEAWLVVDELELREASGCDGAEDAQDAVVRGPFAVELVSGQELPVAPMRGVPASTFCRLELDLSVPDEPAALPAGSPPQLASASIFVRGRRADGVAFELLVDTDDELHLDSGALPFELAAGRQPLLVTFAVETWLTGVALDDITGEDPIVISESRHSELLEGFDEAFATSARLLRDHDEDGDADPDELDDLLAGDRP